MGLAIAAVVVVIAAAQLLLPSIAAHLVRGRLAKDGTVLSVKVRAVPAIELLWRHAGSVRVRMADYRVEPAQVGTMLSEAGDVGSLTVTIGTLTSGLLTLHDVSLTKRGSELTGSARLEERDLQTALPVIRSVKAVSNPGGPLELRGSASAFGMSASVTATVAVSDGKVVVTPQGVLGLLGTITVYDQRGVYVREVNGSARPGGLELSVVAELR